MTRRGRLLARGVRWRLAASLLTVLASTVAVAVAVLGPLYLHAAGDSVVRRTVSEAPVASTGLTFAADLSQAGNYAKVVADAGQARRVDPGRRFFGTPIYSTTDDSGTPGDAFVFPLTFRSGACGALHMVAGHCTLGADETVVSARSARRLHVSVGGVVHASGLTLRVTGIYAIPDASAPYWFGSGAQIFTYGEPDPAHGPTLDSLFVSAPTAESVVVRGKTGEVVSGPLPHPAVAQLPLRAAAVNLADETVLKRAETQIVARSRTLGIVPVTHLGSVLATADHQRHQMTTIVAVAAIQLVLLAIWVLASLLVRSAEARQSEARAARLRGFPLRSLVWVTAAEPGLLCLAGAVIGIALAWVTVLVVRSSLLAPGSAISFDIWAAIALAVTVLAILGALGAGSLRLLRSTRLSGSGVREGRAAVAQIVDVVLIVLAVIALVALATSGALSGGSNPLAAVAPGLIALGTAVVAVQAILLACRLGVGRTAGSPRIATFLALRQSARRPGLLRQARVLIIALGLACFATAAWSVARSNRASAARFQVGADTVVSVATRSPTALVHAVDAVDPRGHYAMAVATLRTTNAALLAVDPSRLPTSAWPRGLGHTRLSQIIHLIDPRTAPEVSLPRAPLHVTAAVAATGAVARHLKAVQLALWVTNASDGTNIIQLGALNTGTHTYTAAGATGLALACPGGCRLDGVGVVSPSGQNPPTGGAVSLTLQRFTTGTGTGTAIAADLDAGDWGSPAKGVTLDARPGALALTIPAATIAADAGATGGVTPPMAAVADHPANLPAVATDELEQANASLATGVVPSIGLDGSATNVRPVASVPGLPQLGTDATMVNLSLLSRVQSAPASPDVRDAVWLGPDTPGDVLARLRAHGLDPVAVQRASTVLAAMQRTGPALADDFLLLAAIAALIVAAASTLSALGATTRERATELSSLEVAGVPRAALVRALGLESAILLLTALCGAGAGLLAAALAIPSLPERATPSLVPLNFPLPLGLIAIVAVAVLAAVALAAAGVALTLLRRMSPTMLRTAPDDVSL